MPRTLRIHTRLMFATAAALLGGLLAAAPAAGQALTATVLGAVTDTSGAALPGATVEVKHVATGVAQTFTTDESGRYRASALPIGEYEVRASLDGFQTVVRSGINLSVGSELVVNAQLPVGQIETMITVQGGVSVVETTSAAITAVIDQRQMRELPLNGRNFEQLITLAPGVQTVNNPGSAFYGRGLNYSVAGARPEGQSLLLDNTNIQGYFNRGAGAGVLGTSLGVEAIAEFQTLTNSYGAQFGGAGAAVNAISKSGQNAFTGTVYEFLRNSEFDARNYFDGPEKPPFRKNQFGGSLGGPIRTDRAFFFFNYEGLRQTLGRTTNPVVPDANAHRGLVPGPDGTLQNVGVAPSVAPVLALYPVATRPLGRGVGEYTYVRNEVGREDYFLSRVDANLTDKDAFFVRYLFDRATLDAPFGGSLIPLWGEQDKTLNQFLTVEAKRVATNNLLNLLRFSISRPESSAVTVGDTPALNWFPGENRQNGSITISGLTGIGANNLLPFYLIQKRYTIADDLFWTRGAHSLKAGVTFEVLHTDSDGPFRIGGQYQFNSLTAFLQGTPNLLIGPLPNQADARRNFREKDVFVYVQDDWTVTPRLTLNLGLRYEFATNPTEANGKLHTIPDPPRGTGFVNVPTVFAENPSLKNIDPRLGFAYDLTGDQRTALRGGFGLFHNRIQPRTYGGSYWLNPPFFQAQQTFPNFPNVFSTVTPSVLAITNGTYYQTDTTPYMIQYNVNVQREVSPNTTVTVGYVGSRGRNLFVNIDHNPPTLIEVGGVERFGRLAGGRITPNPRLNPGFGTMTMRTAVGESTYNSLQVSLNRRFSNRLQAQVSHTFSRCMDNGSNTFGLEGGGSSPNAMNPYDLTEDWGKCNFDVTHAFRANALIALPFRGNVLVEGWQVSLIASLSSGPPFTYQIGFDQAGTQVNNQRPNLRAGASNNPVTDDPARWFDPSAFELPAPGTLGNVGRNTGTGPGTATFDLALLKTFELPGSPSLQFRGEVFNLFNRANFQLPNANVFTQAANGGGVVSATAGRITSTTTTARQVQFGLKLLF